MNKKSIVLIIVALIALVIIVPTTVVYYLINKPSHPFPTDFALYIDKDDNVDSICHKLSTGIALDQLLHSQKYQLRTGHYIIPAGETSLATFRRLRNGAQDAINLSIPSVRTINKLAGAIGHQLMLDSAEVAEKLTDSTFCQNYGYTLQTIPCLFIPNTYQCYWDTSLERFMQRMVQVNKEFWTAEREKKASSLGMTHNDVITLASIVDSETANNAEKPTVAGLYINRLHKGILLQADPTVIFATGDFTIRRVLKKHLEVESPYNTYKHAGLPPGPIRIPSVAGIDAVLNHEKHTYIYMCAKEDFSGTHNFATTLSQHMANARRYTQALTKRGIMK